MEKIRRLFLSYICVLAILPVIGCSKKIVVNNAFVYLVHDSCYDYGKIGIIINGKTVVQYENYYQWQSVYVGEYSLEVVAVPNNGYKFIKWSDGLTTISRKDLAINENDSTPVVIYAFFEVENGYN